MPFSRPTLSEIYARTRADFVAMSETGGAILRHSVEWMLSAIASRIAHHLYGYISWAVEQMLPDKAEIEGLRRWGGVFGLPQLPATKSSGEYTFTGTDATAIPAGSEVAIGDLLYTTDAEVTIASGTATATITASEAGESGDASAGVIGTLTNPIAGVATGGAVAAGGLIGGTDAETREAYRARILERSSRPSRGGNAADFRQWIAQSEGARVFRSWIYPEGDGPGTVAAAFVVVDESEPVGFAIPDAGEIAAVQDSVDAIRPIFMNNFRAFAPVGVALTVDVSALVVDAGADTATVQAAAEDALYELLSQVAEPGGAIPLSRITEAISSAAGESSHTVAVPAGDATATSGTIFNALVITWP